MGAKPAARPGAIDAKVNALKSSLGDLSGSDARFHSSKTPEGDSDQRPGVGSVNIHVANNAPPLRKMRTPTRSVAFTRFARRMIPTRTRDADGSAVAAARVRSARPARRRALNVVTVHNEALIETGRANSTRPRRLRHRRQRRRPPQLVRRSPCPGAGSKGVGVAGLWRSTSPTTRTKPSLKAASRSRNSGNALVEASGVSTSFVEASPVVVAASRASAPASALTLPSTRSAPRSSRAPACMARRRA